MRTYIAQHFDHFFFLKELQDSRTEVIEMRRKGSQVDSPWVRLQGVQYAR